MVRTTSTRRIRRSLKTSGHLPLKSSSTSFGLRFSVAAFAQAEEFAACYYRGNHCCCFDGADGRSGSS